VSATAWVSLPLAKLQKQISKTFGPERLNHLQTAPKLKTKKISWSLKISVTVVGKVFWA